jgi:type I restriction enzyme S subunit
MSNISRVKISELGKTITGKTPSSNNPEDFGSDYMFVTPSDSFDKKMMNLTERYLSEEGVQKLSSKLLPPNSIMVTCIGSAMGKVSMNETSCVTNQQINSIVPNNNFDPHYIYYTIKNNYKVLRNAATGSTAVPLLNKTDFDILELSIHKDLPTQKSIAKVLSDLDAKIELNNKINRELEAMAKTLYDYWFVQFDFPNADGKPYKSSGGKMVYNAELKREIPEGWEVKNIFKCCKVQYGFPFSTEFFNTDSVGIPVIRIRDVLENNISNYSSEKDIDEKYLIKKGDLLIGMDGNFHINYWSKDGCYLNQRVVKLSKTILPNIILKHQIEPYIKLREKSVSRTTVGHLSDKDLKALNVIVPSKEVLVLAEPIFNHTLNRIIKTQNENQHLTALRDWLLPMLMNGQVTLKESEEKLSMAAEPSVKYGN